MVLLKTKTNKEKLLTVAFLFIITKVKHWLTMSLKNKIGDQTTFWTKHSLSAFQ